MKFGSIAAGHLCRGMTVEPVWLVPFKSVSVKYMGYENITRDTEMSAQQLCKERLILAKGKSLKFKIWDSVDDIWAKPMAVRPYGTLWNCYFLKGYSN